MLLCYVCDIVALSLIITLSLIVLLWGIIYFSRDEYLSNGSLSIVGKYPSIRYFLYSSLLPLFFSLIIYIANLNYIECFCDSLIGYSGKSFLNLLVNLIIYIIYPIVFIILFDFIFLNFIVAKIKNFVLPIQFYKEEISRDTLFLNKNKAIPLNYVPKSEQAYILSTNYRFNEHGTNNLALVVNFIWQLALYESKYKKFFYTFLLGLISFLFYLAVVFFYFHSLLSLKLSHSFSFVLFSVFWSLYTVVWLKKLFGLDFFLKAFELLNASAKKSEIASEIDYLTLYNYDIKSGNMKNITDKLRLFYEKEIKKNEEKELEYALAFTITVLLTITLAILT